MSVQIIGYRPFKKSSGEDGIKQLHFSNITISSVKNMLNNMQEIIKHVPEHERFNLHFTCASCIPPSADGVVGLREFDYQEYIPFDIDHPDLESTEDYLRIFFQATGLDRTKCMIVLSGNGIHIHVIPNTRITTIDQLYQLRKNYLGLAKELNSLLFKEALTGEFDKQRFSRSATMRLPLTRNLKDGIEKECRIYEPSVVEEQPFNLERWTDITSKNVEVNPATGILEKFTIDTPAVLSGCDFLNYCKDNQGVISEPQWQAMITILAQIPDIGEQLCHSYSCGHPQYTESACQEKIERAKSFGRARVCSSIEELYHNCSKCPHYEQVKTPLQIKGDDFIATKATGFHVIEYDKNGMPKKPRPCYEDLLKFFKSEYNYVCNADTGMVSVYKGTHWEDITDVDLDSFSTKNFNPLADNKMRSEFKGLIKACNVVNNSFFEDTCSGFVNFKNGVLHVESRTLSEHSSKFGFKHVLPYDYNPNAACPEFDLLLQRVTLSDKELQDLVMEYVGYILSGEDPFKGQKAMIFTGEGSNGKSTLLTIIRNAVGISNSSAVDLKGLNDINMRYSLRNKLVNISEEEKYDSLRDSSMFKSIVTGGTVSVKLMYHQPFQAKITAKLLIGCNDLPPTNDHSDATYRRMLIVPFRAHFGVGEGSLPVNRNIIEDVNREMSGVYNKIIDGYSRYRAKGFTQAGASARALQEYVLAGDIIAQFIDECLDSTERGVNIFMSNQEVFSEFQEWKRQNNYKVEYCSAVFFKRFTKVTGLKSFSKGGTRGYPIKLKQISNM